MLKYYKLNKKERVAALEPSNNETWIKHGISEFVGTICLSLLFAGLSIVVSQDGSKIVSIEEFFISPLVIGFYAGFIGIGFLLVVFLRWSCDLNPAVTIIRMFNGTNTYRYGFFKIAMQFLAAIMAGLLIYGFGSIHSTSSSRIANYAIDAYKVSQNQFIGELKGNEAFGGFLIFAVELVATLILLFPIFSKRIDDKYRDIMIMLMISLGVVVGITVGSAALNPARGLAQQVPGLFFGASVGGSKDSSLIIATFAMLAGTILSPFLYLIVQDLTDRLNVPFTKAIDFKNNRANNMKRLKEI